MCRFIIDLKAVLDKFNDTKKRLNDGVKVCAVVKANAYGFGIEKITKLLENRVDYFAVARISEFLKIKKNGIKTPVLILSPLLDKDLKIAIKNGAEITVNSLQIAENIENIAKQNNMHAKVHVKVDSGMNRYGFKDFKEYKETLKFIKKGKNIELVGVYSHFYDSAEDVTDGQFDVFEKYKKAALRSKLKPIFHIASSATLSNKKYQLDMVRLGIDLYLSDKHSLESRVLQLKDVKCGERISYAGTFVAQRNMKIAICSGGYADGISRKLSNVGKVIINGHKTEIVGRVCMDCFMIDVTEIDVNIGDRVLVFGKTKENCISVCEVASWCDTIPYEIYTGISSRVKRVYHWRNYAGNFWEVQGKKAYKP